MQKVLYSQEPFEYRVVSTIELNDFFQKNHSDILKHFQDEQNYASITILKDESVILFPAVGNEGIWYRNQFEYEKMKQSGYYPVKGDNSFWEKEKDNIIQINTKISDYFEKLSKDLGFNVEINQDSVYLSILSEKINNHLLTRKKKDDEIYYIIALYIAESIRNRINGDWELLPIYTLNVYYIPEITLDEKFCNPWNYIIGQLKMYSFLPVDIYSLIEKSNFFVMKNGRKYYR